MKQRNTLEPAFSLMAVALERLHEITDAKSAQEKEALEPLFDILLDLAEVLDLWSLRLDPTITRLQREEIGKDFLCAHRLITANGLEFVGLHEMLTKAKQAIELAQQERVFA